MIRQGIAPGWLAAWRMGSLLRPPARAGSFRMLLLHDVPRDRQAEFRALIHRVRERHGLIGVAEAEAQLAGQLPTQPEKRPPFLLSFDDGFASNHRIAQEVLDPLGLTALFFVCPTLMDLEPGAQRDAIAARIFRGHKRASDLTAEQRLMTWEELQQLTAQGHRIGAHGLTHQRLTDLRGEALRQEIVGAGEVLAARLGQPVDWTAYAFGDIGSISAEALSIIAEQYKYCRSGVRGFNNTATHPLALRADQIDLGDSKAWQDLSLEGALDFRYAEARRRLDGMIPI
ncbi:polysaccharide deacetylase family protein [Magnetospira thiophila]